MFSKIIVPEDRMLIKNDGPRIKAVVTDPGNDVDNFRAPFFDNEGTIASIEVNDLNVFNCASLFGGDADSIQPVFAAIRILETFIDNFDPETKNTHKQAREFLTLLLNATKFKDDSNIVLWDGTNYILLGFSLSPIGKNVLDLRSFVSDDVKRHPQSTFSADLIQAWHISDKSLEDMKGLIGEENLKINDVDGSVMLML